MAEWLSRRCCVYCRCWAEVSRQFRLTEVNLDPGDPAGRAVARRHDVPSADVGVPPGPRIGLSPGSHLDCPQAIREFRGTRRTAVGVLGEARKDDVIELRGNRSS